MESKDDVNREFSRNSKGANRLTGICRAGFYTDITCVFEQIKADHLRAGDIPPEAVCAPDSRASFFANKVRLQD